MKSFTLSLIALLYLSVAAAAQTPEPKSAAPLKAIAVLHPTEGNKVSGTVTFTEEADGVRVQADLTGLTLGKHGFHGGGSEGMHSSSQLDWLDRLSASSWPGLSRPSTSLFAAPPKERRGCGAKSRA